MIFFEEIRAEADAWRADLAAQKIDPYIQMASISIVMEELDANTRNIIGTAAGFLAAAYANYLDRRAKDTNVWLDAHDETIID